MSLKIRRCLGTTARSLRASLPFIVICVTAVPALGQAIEPLALSKKIFGKEPFPNIEKYVTGEYKGKPNGKDLQRGSTTRFLLLGQTGNKAVVAMTILDSTGKGLDTYLHFEKDSLWKMNAFRGLAMTGLIERAKTELEKMTPGQVDEIIENGKKAKSNEYFIFGSKEDYHFKLGNARLTLDLDENIIQHFIKNKAAFERLKEAALKELAGNKSDGEPAVKLVENLSHDYRNLFISAVSYGDHLPGPKCLDFSIGGMLDNTVGYLYVSDKKDLPEMSDRKVIMLREIADGWYLYKTT